MKTLRTIILAVLTIAALTAANPPTWQQDYTYPNMIGTNPQYAGSAIATAAPISSVFFGHFTNLSDPTQTTTVQVGTIAFDMLDKDHATLTATYNGVTQTYATIYGLLNAAVTDQWNAQQGAAKAAAAGSPAKATAAKPGGG